MIASSTTMPTAMTKPASTIVLIDAPRKYSTSTAATSDSGIDTRLISAVAPLVQEGDEDQDDQRAADDQRDGQVAKDVSMNVAGRKIVASISIPGKPGRSSSRTPLDAVGDLERVGTRELLDHEQQAGLAVDDGVAGERWVALHDLCHVGQAEPLAAPVEERDLRQLSRVVDRVDVVHPEALVRRLHESARPDRGDGSYFSSGASSASDVAASTISSVV